MKAPIYICNVTVSVGTHIRGNKYEWSDYSVKNIPLILIDGKPASEKQYSGLKNYVITEHKIKGNVLCRNVRITEKKFSSNTVYDFDAKIH